MRKAAVITVDIFLEVVSVPDEVASGELNCKPEIID
jgi:hypothetical protein